MNVLILGGGAEASEIARALAGDPAIRAVLSLAGRTRAPAPSPIPSRSGGFGGVEGLARYLRDEAIDALVDATHPFAAQISRHALEAAAKTRVPRLAVIRPAWERQPGDVWPGDVWIDVADMAAAAIALGARPRRVFLTIGQQELAPFAAAPWHDYLIRSVEPPAPAALPPRARCIAARGPFDADAEQRLLAAEAIEVLVTKNSGGSATVAKLTAARALGLPVVMVARPAAVAGETAADAPQALAWLRHQLSVRRGV